VLYIDFVKELFRNVLKTSGWWVKAQQIVMANPLLFACLLFVMIVVLTCAVWEARRANVCGLGSKASMVTAGKGGEKWDGG